MTTSPEAQRPTPTRLAAAVRGGDLSLVRSMLQQRPELVKMELAANDEHTALHHAVLSRDVEMVRVLMAAGANARKGIWPHRDATSAHTLAKDRGYDEIVAAIEGSEDDRREEISRSHAPVLPESDRSSAVTLPDDEQAALRTAVALGDLERVRGLIWRDRGVLNREIDSRGGLLSLAVNHGQLQMIRLLAELGADVNERHTLPNLDEPTVSFGEPLWYAARGGRVDIAELLLDLGADPNTQVYASGWAIDHAYQQRNEPLKRLLLERGAKLQPWTVTVVHDVEAAGRMLAQDASEKLANDLAWGACLNGCPGIVELALPRLKWPKEDGRWNWFLVQPIRGHDRAEHEDLFACMELLVRYGIDVNLPNRHGETVLHYTMADGDPTGDQRLRFVELLLDSGARLDIRDDLLRSTPLGWAARWGRRDAAEFLLERGAPAREKDAEPWATPLAWAIRQGHAATAALLRAKIGAA